MEPEVEVYCKKEKKDCNCLWLITAIIAVVLSFFIGVLVTSLTSIATLLGTGALVALIISLIILLIIAIISLLCCKKNTDKKKKCCCY